MNKKGAIELSASTIVILVIAIVVLGLALGFITGMFGNIGQKFGNIVDETSLADRPTADNPITIPGTINVKQKSTTNVMVGFYNKEADTLRDVGLEITKCKDDENKDTDSVPILIAPEADLVESGKIVGFSSILSLKNNEDFKAGRQYICTLKIEGESKSFYILVTS